ncbi:MAG: molybdopterin converting factor subunit 1 [Haliea sp.]|nr:molybdopterin converting factor subunit 1 [Haliea sp.]
MLRVLFFARLREQLGCEALDLKWAPEVNCVAALRAVLALRGEPWQQALADDNLVAAVNQVVADAATPISSGDEVAFFPPVTGG